jgi:molybdenum cofactor guanylyltransferase
MAGSLRDSSVIILAGGRGRRHQNNDKGLVDFQGRPLIEHVLDRIKPQVSDIVISANRNLSHYQSYGYPVVPDTIEGFAGPLAGIVSALPFCAHDWVLVTPCDMPFLPANLAATLYDGLNNHPLSVAVTGDGFQLVLMLHRSLQVSLHDYVLGGNHKVRTWLRSQAHSRVEFSSAARAFDNLNTPDALGT